MFFAISLKDIPGVQWYRCASVPLLFLTEGRLSEVITALYYQNWTLMLQELLFWSFVPSFRFYNTAKTIVYFRVYKVQNVLRMRRFFLLENRCLWYSDWPTGLQFWRIAGRLHLNSVICNVVLLTRHKAKFHMFSMACDILFLHAVYVCNGSLESFNRGAEAVDVRSYVSFLCRSIPTGKEWFR